MARNPVKGTLTDLVDVVIEVVKDFAREIDVDTNEIDAINAETGLMGDLGFESIDYLDLSLRLTKRLKIQRPTAPFYADLKTKAPSLTIKQLTQYIIMSHPSYDLGE